MKYFIIFAPPLEINLVLRGTLNNLLLWVVIYNTNIGHFFYQVYYNKFGLAYGNMAADSKLIFSFVTTSLTFLKVYFLEKNNLFVFSDCWFNIDGLFRPFYWLIEKTLPKPEKNFDSFYLFFDNSSDFFNISENYIFLDFKSSISPYEFEEYFDFLRKTYGNYSIFLSLNCESFERFSKSNNVGLYNSESLYLAYFYENFYKVL